MYNTLIKYVVAVVVLVGTHWAAYYSGKQEALKDVKVVEQIYKERLNTVQNRHDESVEILEREYDKQITDINNSLSVALNRLQQRPTRPQVITETREIREPCTGRELFREDGEFLTREAARAERVVKERDYYFQRYEEARLMLERLNNE